MKTKSQNTVTWKTAPTRTIDVNGVPFAYRVLGPELGVSVVFLHHLTAVLDDWDPRVIDGIAAEHRVIAFDNNRGVGSTGSSVAGLPGRLTMWLCPPIGITRRRSP